jgi:hypothetical protein
MKDSAPGNGKANSRDYIAGQHSAGSALDDHSRSGRKAACGLLTLSLYFPDICVPRE